MLRLLCAVLMMGAFAGPARAATLFTEDFESSVAALQSKYSCSYSFPAPWTDGAPQDWDSAQKFDGSNSLKMTYTGTQNWNPPQGGGHCEYDYADQTNSEIWVTW